MMYVLRTARNASTAYVLLYATLVIIYLFYLAPGPRDGRGPGLGVVATGSL